MDQVFDLSFHNPEPFRIEPTALPPAAQLPKTKTPTLVLWGESDRIADPDYGRAYVAAVPTARFELLEDTGHMPQVENPDQLLRTIGHWVETDLSNTAR